MNMPFSPSSSPSFLNPTSSPSSLDTSETFFTFEQVNPRHIELFSNECSSFLNLYAKEQRLGLFPSPLPFSVDPFFNIRSRNETTRKIKDLSNSFANFLGLKIEEKVKSIFSNEVSNKKNNSSSQYAYKNFPRILGQTVIRKLLQEKSTLRKKLNELIIKKKSEFTAQQFRDWLKKEELFKKYITLANFRIIWDPISNKKNFLLDSDDKKCEILTEITKFFLAEEAYTTLIKESCNNKRNLSIESYLEIIPVFLAGIENPSNFKNLKI